MMVIKTVEELKEVLFRVHSSGKSVGLVPTMGALHDGHLSLIKRARRENQATVCSIFVNPTQFNNKEDLEKYPRTLDNDLELIEDYVDFVFAPTAEEVYKEPATEHYDFGDLEKVMEGPMRPGHFNGVAIIVKRLFDWVKPEKAYFGEKDFQQIAIIKSLVKQYHLDIEIIPCPIVREASGLALSSRNKRLSEYEHKQAANIYRILQESTRLETTDVAKIRQFVTDEIAKVDTFRLEYYEIVDGETLQPIKDLNDTDSVVGCITVYCGEIRLIDNIRYK
ncbi:MAG: pantoate--beta-alanine ligase [Bacteroidales bacterium]|nr:pantoate--beta-alanine ligase [Bacteroidales bacterium]